MPSRTAPRRSRPRFARHHDGVFVVTHDGRQRPRLAPPGDPRFQRRDRRHEYDRLRHPGRRGPDDRAGLAPARDHEPGAHRRHDAAGLRRHAADRDRRPGNRGRRPVDRGLGCHGQRPGDRRLRFLERQLLDHAHRRIGPAPPGPGGTVTYQIVVAAGEDLVATAQAEGATTSLSLLDAQGQVLVQSDGLSAAEPDRRDRYLHRGPARTRSRSTSTGGDGTFTLDDHADASRRAVSADPGRTESAAAIVAGDFNGDGRTRPGRRQLRRQHGVGAAGQRRRHVPAPGHLRGRGRTQTPSWRATSTATASSTWPSPTTATTRCRCCWATATARSSPRSPTRSGSYPDAIVAGDFNGDGQLDLAVANYGRQHRVGAAGQRRRHVPAPGHLRGRGRAQTPSWRATSTATASLDLAVANDGDNDVSVLLGNGDGTFQPQVTYAVGVGPRRHRGGGLQRRRPPRPGRRQLRRQRRVGAAGQRRRHVPAPGHLRGRGRAQTPSWRGTSTATAASTWPSPTLATATSRCCWATATAPSSPRSPTRSGSYPDRHRGGGLQRRRPARPGRRQRISATTSRCCWATATARSRPQAERERGRGRPRTPSWRGTSTATAGSTWPSPTTAPTTSRCCWATATARSSPQVTYAVGVGPRRASWRVTSTATAGSTWPSPTTDSGQRRVGAAGQRRRHVPARRSPTRSGIDSRRASWRATSTATADLDLAVANCDTSTASDGDGVGAAGQRRRHVPAPGHLRGRDRTQTPSWRATSTATAASTWPSPT